MIQRDPEQEDRAELAESKRAVAAAESSTAELEVALVSLHRTSSNIRSIVEPNGYVERFRRVLRGA